MKPFILLVSLSVGAQPSTIPSTRQFDTMRDCMIGLREWVLATQEYVARNHIATQFKYGKTENGQSWAAIFRGVGWGSCGPSDTLSNEGRQAVESSP